MTLSRLIDELHRLIETTSPHAETHVSAVWRESFMNVRIDHDIKSSEAEQMQEEIDSLQGKVEDLRGDLAEAEEAVERLTQSVKTSEFTIESQKLIIAELTQKLNGK